jgi:hypothetical protein
MKNYVVKEVLTLNLIANHLYVSMAYLLQWIVMEKPQAPSDAYRYIHPLLPCQD